MALIGASTADRTWPMAVQVGVGGLFGGHDPLLTWLYDSLGWARRKGGYYNGRSFFPYWYFL